MFEAKDLVKQAIERHGDNIAVACSFGKDSIVVLHIALKYDPNIKVMFNNTGVEFPETITYKKMLVRKWDLNLIETKPIKGFWECVNEYGIPQVRGKGKNRTPKCCYYCKEKPAMVSFKENKVVAVITGLMAEESRNRRLLAIRYNNTDQEKDDIMFCGQRYYAKSWGLWKYHPLMYWKEKEIWSYIKNNKIPINPVYTKWGGLYPRCGCLPCTAYKSWEERLSKSHHNLYLKLKKIQCPTQQRLNPPKPRGKG